MLGSKALTVTVLPSKAVSVPAAQPLVPHLSRFLAVWPVVGLALAAIVNVAWMAVLGYGLFRLVL
jgi:hypothetical protein